LKQPTIKGQQVYAVEAKVRQGDKCDATGCEYVIQKVEGGSVKNETKKLNPSMAGFKECLKQSGVIVDGKINAAGIDKKVINEGFDGLSYTAPLMFLSTGPQNNQVGPKYTKSFSYENGCESYEPAHPEVQELVIAKEARKRRLDAEAAKLSGCKAEEYGKLTKFMQDYEEYQGQLGQIRDKLILESVAKAAAKLDKKEKVKPEELAQILKDFNDFIIKPRMEKIQLLSDAIADAGDEEKKALQEEMKKILAELKSLQVKPYFTQDHIKTLTGPGVGDFENALTLTKVRSILTNYSRIGQRENGGEIDVKYANRKIMAEEEANIKSFKEQIEVYKYKTGEDSGNAQKYAQEANNARQRYNSYVADKMRYIYELSVAMQKECSAKFTGTLVQSCQARYQTALQANIQDLNQTAPD
jgi:hypothetical protein